MYPSRPTDTSWQANPEELSFIFSVLWQTWIIIKATINKLQKKKSKTKLYSYYNVFLTKLNHTMYKQQNLPYNTMYIIVVKYTIHNVRVYTFNLPQYAQGSKTDLSEI